MTYTSSVAYIVSVRGDKLKKRAIQQIMTNFTEKTSTILKSINIDLEEEVVKLRPLD